MIKDTELRKGNLLILIVNYMQVVHRVDEIYTDEVKVTSIGNNACLPRMSLRTCHPIPLTPEWLERFFYKKDLLDGKYYKQGSVLPPLYWINECRWGMSTLPVTGHHLQYVHQLQNLYFTLTGEELNVTL